MDINSLKQRMENVLAKAWSLKINVFYIKALIIACSVLALGVCLVPVFFSDFISPDFVVMVFYSIVAFLGLFVVISILYKIFCIRCVIFASADIVARVEDGRVTAASRYFVLRKSGAKYLHIGFNQSKNRFAGVLSFRPHPRIRLDFPYSGEIFLRGFVDQSDVQNYVNDFALQESGGIAIDRIIHERIAAELKKSEKVIMDLLYCFRERMVDLIALTEKLESLGIIQEATRGLKSVKSIQLTFEIPTERIILNYPV